MFFIKLICYMIIWGLVLRYILWIIDANVDTVGIDFFDEENKIDYLICLKKMIIIIINRKIFHHFPFLLCRSNVLMFWRKQLTISPHFYLIYWLPNHCINFHNADRFESNTNFKPIFFIFSFNNFSFVTIFIQFLLYVMLCSAHTEIQFCSIGYFSLLILWLIVVDVDLYFIVLK